MTTTNSDIETLLAQMTLEEKASLCSAQDEWTTKPVERLGIPAIWVADGPHGVRKAPAGNVGGYGDQHPATCYPTASALAASWNRDLLERVGSHLGRECQALGVNVLLGPGVNIKRSPLGGRNFEYFSEDPLLAGELGAAYIKGVQKEGVGTSLKHFACNSQETARMVTESVVDERTLREIYLTNFEIAVKKGNPWTIMAAYNPVNGEDATANRKLLHEILAGEWGYEGVVISDWVSVYDRVQGVLAGMHIEFPGNGGINDALIVQAVTEGRLAETDLDALLRPVMGLIFKAKDREKPKAVFNPAAHHRMARETAAECCVLLKNEGGILPIVKGKYRKIALIGEFAEIPRFQGNGSSEVKPTALDTLKDELFRLAGNDFDITYTRGFSLEDDRDTSFIPEAAALAAESDLVLLHLGLPQSYESEGKDREHLHLPPAQTDLLEAVCRVRPETAVLLTNGSAVVMEWIDRVPAVLETWLGGQAAGGAIADVLTGRVNPSGKLAETFPRRLEDTPAFLDLPGKNRKLFFGEGIFTGYRWYDKRAIEPLFPFGHGLSYTSFEYSGLTLSAPVITEKETLTVSCTLKNTGTRTGREVVQLYLNDQVCRLPRPVRELKGFCKPELAPGESTVVVFELSGRDFAFYDESFGGWITESGDFEVQIGSSSRDIRLKGWFSLDAVEKVPLLFDERTTLREWIRYPETRALVLPLVGDWFRSIPSLFVGDISEFRITNDFFLDMPLLKYHNLSRGSISREAIGKTVTAARSVRVKL
jgi:beta-glucosidase